MAVEGQWRTYSITLAWSAYDETLRLICTFEMEPPAERLGELYEAAERASTISAGPGPSPTGPSRS